MKSKELNNLSFDEYITIEKESEKKHEFHDGTIVAMAGGTIAHGLISGNTLIEIAMQLRANKSKCIAINSEVKLQISQLNKYLYPDAMVVCNDITELDNNAVVNPTVIIEVLSKSTEAYDRGDKFFFYKQIPSLQAYILIDQYQARIDLYTKKADLWKITRTEGMDESVYIDSINVHLPLKNIYQNVFK